MVAPWAALLAGAFVSGQAVFHGRELLAELPLILEIIRVILKLYEQWKNFDERKEMATILSKMPKPKPPPNSSNCSVCVVGGGGLVHEEMSSVLGSNSPPSAGSADPNAALHEVPSTRLANITNGSLGPRALLTTSSSALSWRLTTGAVQALERPANSQKGEETLEAVPKGVQQAGQARRTRAAHPSQHLNPGP
ncbi:hypothetical protein A6R68_19267, partial [Neotoma lepida]